MALRRPQQTEARRYHRALRVAALLRPHRPRIADPAEGQLARIEAGDLVATFANPVAMNLTGLPSTWYTGETATPQRIIAYPQVMVSPDPQVGISDRQAWPTAGRRGAAGRPLP